MLLFALLAPGCDTLDLRPRALEGPGRAHEEEEETGTDTDDRDDEDDTAADDTADDDTAADTDTGHDSAAAGAELYTTNCASCHGEDGKLGASGASDLSRKVPGLTDAEITDVVRNGKKSMPAFTLTDPEMADLLVHLRATFGGPP